MADGAFELELGMSGRIGEPVRDVGSVNGALGVERERERLVPRRREQGLQIGASDGFKRSMTARAAGFVKSSAPMPASWTDWPAKSAQTFSLIS